MLIVAFGGKTNALIPLYAVGVFIVVHAVAAGMVRHHQKEREPHWRRDVVINGVGAVATAIVDDHHRDRRSSPSGAWVPLVVIPLIVLLFKAIKQHYDDASPRRLRVAPDYKPRRMNHTVVVLVGSVHRGVLEALAYAKSLHARTVCSR